MIVEKLEYKIKNEFIIYNCQYKDDNGYKVFDKETVQEIVDVYENNSYISFPSLEVDKFGYSIRCAFLFWLIDIHNPNLPKKIKLSIDINNFDGAKEYKLIPWHSGCNFYNFTIELPVRNVIIDRDISNMINLLYFENKVQLESKKEISVWIKWESLDNLERKNNE